MGIMSETKNDPIFVAFYTKESPYEKEAEELVKTLDKFSLPHYIFAEESTGSWETNTQLKSFVLLKAMMIHAGRAIVYLDADARVLQKPELFYHIDCDLAFHYFRGHELLSGTLYFSNKQTPEGNKSLALVREWDTLNRENPGRWDQKTLQLLVESKDDLDWLQLPESYVYIDRLATRGVVPIIYHTQASRRLRGLING